MIKILACVKLIYITLSNKCCHIQCNFTGCKIISYLQLNAILMLQNHINVLETILSQLERNRIFFTLIMFKLKVTVTVPTAIVIYHSLKSGFQSSFKCNGLVLVLMLLWFEMKMVQP